MAQDSKIEWTHHTANLWHGCTKVHEGCDNCYAETLSKRWGNDIWGNDKPRKAIISVWNDLSRFQKMAKEAEAVHRVFVGSMMDIFEKPIPIVGSNGNPYLFNGKQADTDFLRQRFFNEVVPNSTNLMFLLLTKRPSNINKYIPESWKTNPPSNVMFGTSPVNQETADTLIQQLLKINGKHFLSIEPQLDEIDLSRWIPEGREAIRRNNGEKFIAPHYFMVECKNCGWIGSSEFVEGGGQIADTGDCGDIYCPKCNAIEPEETENVINWIIQGGESGHHSRPFNLEWAYKMKEQCASANVPYFFKQIDKVQQIPEDLMVRQFPD